MDPPGPGGNLSCHRPQKQCLLCRIPWGSGGCEKKGCAAGASSSQKCTDRTHEKTWLWKGISLSPPGCGRDRRPELPAGCPQGKRILQTRSEEHTSELQSRLHLA